MRHPWKVLKFYFNKKSPKLFWKVIGSHWWFKIFLNVLCMHTFDNISLQCCCALIDAIKKLQLENALVFTDLSFWYWYVSNCICNSIERSWNRVWICIQKSSNSGEQDPYTRKITQQTPPLIEHTTDYLIVCSIKGEVCWMIFLESVFEAQLSWKGCFGRADPNWSNSRQEVWLKRYWVSTYVCVCLTSVECPTLTWSIVLYCVCAENCSCSSVTGCTMSQSSQYVVCLLLVIV